MPAPEFQNIFPPEAVGELSNAFTELESVQPQILDLIRYQREADFEALAVSLGAVNARIARAQAIISGRRTPDAPA